MRPVKSLSLFAGAVVVLGGVANANNAWGQNDETRAIVADMLADTEARSSLMQEGLAGHDKGFFVSDPSGAFHLTVFGGLQFRYVWSERDVSDDDESDHSFQYRRARLGIKGKVFENFGFHVRGSFGRDGGAFGLDDAYMYYKFGNGLTVKWGQFKAKVLRESGVQGFDQLAIERSYVHHEFDFGRTQGVQVAYAQDDWRAWATFSDGANPTTNPAKNSDLGKAPDDINLSARAEFLLHGSWGGVRDYRAVQNAETTVMLGVAGAYGQGRRAGAAGPVGNGSDTSMFTVDMSANGDSWSAFVAYVMRRDDPASGVVREDNALLVQGSAALSDRNDVFARLAYVDMDGDADPMHVLTVGGNHYFHGQASKLTVDVVFYVDDGGGTSGRFVADKGQGMALNAQEGDFDVRVQHQLKF